MMDETESNVVHLRNSVLVAGHIKIENRLKRT